jgi:hypothetical protein
MITFEQSFQNVFITSDPRSERFQTWFNKELQNYNFQFFSVVKFQICCKAQRKRPLEAERDISALHWTVSCSDYNYEAVHHEFWSDQAEFYSAAQFWELVDFILLNSGNLWMGRRGSLHLSLCPPCKDWAVTLQTLCCQSTNHHNGHLGAGCHSATKTSIILSVRIVENFFWVMHASMNSSWVICPSWFSSISWKASKYDDNDQVCFLKFNDQVCDVDNCFV